MCDVLCHNGCVNLSDLILAGCAFPESALKLSMALWVNLIQCSCQFSVCTAEVPDTKLQKPEMPARGHSARQCPHVPDHDAICLRLQQDAEQLPCTAALPAELPL